MGTACTLFTEMKTFVSAAKITQYNLLETEAKS